MVIDCSYRLGSLRRPRASKQIMQLVRGTNQMVSCHAAILARSSVTFIVRVQRTIALR